MPAVSPPFFKAQAAKLADSKPERAVSERSSEALVVLLAASKVVPLLAAKRVALVLSLAAPAVLVVRLAERKGVPLLEGKRAVSAPSLVVLVVRLAERKVVPLLEGRKVASVLFLVVLVVRLAERKVVPPLEGKRVVSAPSLVVLVVRLVVRKVVPLLEGRKVASVLFLVVLVVRLVAKPAGKKVDLARFSAVALEPEPERRRVGINKVVLARYLAEGAATAAPLRPPDLQARRVHQPHRPEIPMRALLLETLHPVRRVLLQALPSAAGPTKTTSHIRSD